jgi:hypothetical protein
MCNNDDDITYVFPPNNSIMRKLVNIKLKDIAYKYDIDHSTYSERYYKHFNERIEGVCIRIHLKKDIMYRYRLNLFKIKYILESSINDIIVIPSPTIHGILEVAYSDSQKNIALLAHGLLGVEPKDSLSNVQIHGISNIVPLSLVENNYIVCKGSNINGIASVRGVDVNRTFTSNIMSTYHTYGIEITREVMKHHLKNMFGSSINMNALDILISNMLVYGRPISVSHRGVIEQDRSTLFRLSYEHFMEHLKAIPLKGEFELKDPYDMLAVGIPLEIGTGSVDVRSPRLHN